MYIYVTKELHVLLIAIIARKEDQRGVTVNWCVFSWFCVGFK